MVVSTQPNCCRTHRCAGNVVRNTLAQIVDPHTAFDGECPLEQTFGGHLAGIEGDPLPSLRHAHRDRERKGGFAAADISTENDQVVPTDPTPEDLVEAGKPGGDRVRRFRAFSDRIGADENLRDR
jgi:hypothetical protein